MINKEIHDLNHIIATRILKWRFEESASPRCQNFVGAGYYNGESYVCNKYNLPLWSTNISDVWSLMRLLEEKGWVFSTSTMKDGRRGAFAEVGVSVNSIDSYHNFIDAEAQIGDMPLAICRALSKAASLIEKH